MPSPSKPLQLTVGSHVSAAGGVAKAIQRATEVGCDCLQIFTKNNNQWAAKPLSDEQVAAWLHAYAASGLQHPIAHASYLINLASPDESLWQKSIDALAVEWQRADRLQLEGLVVHPGAFTSSSESAGMSRIAEGLQRVIEQAQPQGCRLLLENTAGQGSCLGHRIAQLGWLLERAAPPECFGVCFDTCHAFAAGYDLRDPIAFAALMQEIRDELPADAIRAVHLNDSKKECGSRVDRHEHIGQGCLGDEGFLQFFSAPLFARLPGYLETAKGSDPATGEDFDRMNLQRLRALACRIETTN